MLCHWRLNSPFPGAMQLGRYNFERDQILDLFQLLGAAGGNPVSLAGQAGLRGPGRAGKPVEVQALPGCSEPRTGALLPIPGLLRIPGCLCPSPRPAGDSHNTWAFELPSSDNRTSVPLSFALRL